MPNKTNNFLKLCVLISTCFVFLPVFLSSTNFWDGAIFSFAIDSRDLEGLSVFVEEGRFHFVSIFASGAMFISKFINRDYFFIHKVFAIIIYLVLSREIRLFVVNSLNFTRNQTALVYILTSIFPIWHLLQTSSLDYFFFFVAIGLFGVRQFNSKNKFRIIFGLIFIILSFEVGSMMTFVLALHLISSQAFSTQGLRKTLATKKFQVLIVGIISYWILTKQVFPPNGLYESYNSFFIPNTFQDFKTLYFMMNIIFDYLSIIGLALLFVFVFTVFSNKEGFTLKEEMSVENITLMKKSSLLFIGSVIPYLAVGKISSINSGTVNSRFLLLLCFTIPILIVTMLRVVSQVHIYHKYLTHMVVLFVAILPYLSLTVPYTISSHVHFLNRQFFTRELFDALGDSTSSLPPGIVQFKNLGHPVGFDLSIYDTNYQLWKLFGESYYWSALMAPEQSSLKIPAWAYVDSKYFKFHASSLEPYDYCTTTIEFVPIGFSSLKDKMVNILPFANADSRVIIDSVDSVCPD